MKVFSAGWNFLGNPFFKLPIRDFVGLTASWNGSTQCQSHIKVNQMPDGIKTEKVLKLAVHLQNALSLSDELDLTLLSIKIHEAVYECQKAVCSVNTAEQTDPLWK